jgi:hypothetical protein
MTLDSVPCNEAYAAALTTESFMPGTAATGHARSGFNGATPHNFRTAIVARTDGFHSAGGVRRAPGQHEDMKIC